MLRRNGLVVKSVESVLRLEGSLWWERFVKEVYNANMLHVHHILLKRHAVTIISFQIWVTKQWKQRPERFHLIVIDWYRLWICCKANVFVDLSRLYSGQAQTFWMPLVCVICTPCLKKNVPPLACYNFDTHEWILIFFGRNVTDKVGNQKTLYYATSNNLCFCTTWQNAETRKSHISLSWIVLHTQCTCVLSSWKKKIVICDVFDSV